MTTHDPHAQARAYVQARLDDRLAQRQDALGRRIAVMPVAQSLDGRLDNVARRLEVRLADAEIDDRLALPLQVCGARQHLEGGLRSQPLQVRHELQHGVSPLSCCRGSSRPA